MHEDLVQQSHEALGHAPAGAPADRIRPTDLARAAGVDEAFVVAMTDPRDPRAGSVGSRAERRLPHADDGVMLHGDDPAAVVVGNDDEAAELCAGSAVSPP